MTVKNEAANSLKILVCGMPRSMTTWAFNVVRQLLSGAELQTLWIEPNSAEEVAFCNARGLVLGKCHHYSQALADAASIVVYSYRDVRTAAVSARRKFGYDGSEEQITSWIAAMDRWKACADVILRYEAMVEDAAEAVARMRAVLESHGLRDLPSDRAALMARVDAGFVARQDADRSRFDAQTLVLGGHRTFQPPPEQLDGDERALYEFVGARFGEWLNRHGYAEADAPDNYGQEVEYQIAAAVLARMPGCAVVDIGVEKGSFVELALRSGAGSVAGFEPLPRHLADLRERFRAVSKVTIYPFAVSDRSGSAQFHVAVDRDGHELDYHHTLADLGDSATVVRSARAIDVRTVALQDLVHEGVLPAQIDFLKVDTDGHDLAVLRGLGDVRPSVVMAEFWDTLPETSGDSPYALHDLVAWAQANGYGECLVVRRHAGMERVEWQAPWTIPGDWGNVFLFRIDVDLAMLRAELQQISLQAHRRMCLQLAQLTLDRERKEVVIQELAAAQEVAQPLVNLPPASAVLGPCNIDDAMQSPLFHEMQAQLLSKERVIEEQQRALKAFRMVLPVVRPALPLLHGGRSLLRLLQPKLGRLQHHEPIPARWPLAAPALSDGNAPRIALVTPSFRQARFLGRTIDSVLQQNYPALEYFVQDGGSDDGSVEVLKSYGDQLSGWVSAPDGGQSQAINAGFARTSGEIMAWLNSDDLLLPGSMATVADYFATHPQVDVVYGHRILIDEEDREIGRWVLPPHSDTVLSWADFVPQETLFWRRSLWEKVGGIDESFRFAMDWDLLLRFRDAGAQMVRLPYFLGAFRIHEAQKTSAVINQIGVQEMARLRRRALGRDVSYAEIRRALVPYLLRHVQSDLAYRVRRRLGTRI